MNFWVLFVALIFLSFFIPAGALLRQTRPLETLRISSAPYHRFFLSAIGWLLLTLALGALLAIEGLGEGGAPSGGLWLALHGRSALAGVVFPFAVGALLWLENGPDALWLRVAGGGWNGAVAGSLAAGAVSGADVFFHLDRACACLALLILLALCVRGVNLMGEGKKVYYFRWALLFSSLGVLGALFSAFGGETLRTLGLRLIGVFLWMGVPLVLTHRLMEEVSGVPLYSRKIMNMALGGWLVLGALSCAQGLGGHGGLMGRVAAVGLWLPMGCMAANLWKTGEHLKEQTLEELAARWKSLGSWMPSTAVGRFLEIGWVCLFLGALVWSATSFEGVSRVLARSLFPAAALHLLAFGTAAVLLSCAYAAWAKSAIPVSERVADIAYWHILAGGCVMMLCMALGGLVGAAQAVAWKNAAGEAVSMPGAVVSSWQTPFWAALIPAAFLLMAGLFIVWRDLSRTRQCCAR